MPFAGSSISLSRKRISFISGSSTASTRTPQMAPVESGAVILFYEPRYGG